MHEPLVGLPGRDVPMGLRRRAIVGGDASHLSLVSSGAEAIVAQGNDELIATGARAKCARRCRPRARRRCARASAVREKRSTFSLAPDAPPRPQTATRDRRILAGRRLDRHRPAGDDRVARSSGHRAAAYASEAARHEPTPAFGPARAHSMTSILAHYSEIALKGKNRPWFVGRLVRNLHGALAGLDVERDPHADGPHRDRARPEVDRRRSARAPDAACSASRNYSRGDRVPLDFDGMADGDRVAACRRRESGRQLSRLGAPRRQAVPDAVAGARARARLARLARARLEGRSRSRRPA